MKMHWRKIASVLTLGVVLTGASFLTTNLASAAPLVQTKVITPSTTTPIKHVVVIFGENISFDHYFGTYPNATNPAGEPAFHASPNTPSVNGLSSSLLTNNPNEANPQRLDRSQAMTCDMDHGYTDEQKAYDNGLVDKFVQYTEGTGTGCNSSTVMDYYDGNTVTALWNYAQNYSLNDNSFDTQFGPSTPGAINLISGQTHGAVAASSNVSAVVNGTDISDADPTYDDCSTTNGNTISMTGTNVGDLLNKQNITWGWFEGGFTPTSYVNGKAVCGSSHKNVGGATVTDYVQHHEPFQYYASTANPHHLPPSSSAMIGKTDQANHQYDLSSFWTALAQNNMPAVSYLKAPAYEDAHAGYSDPLDEQTFLVNTINKIEQSPEWSSTAIILAYDDSDGWYDHVMPTIVNQSDSTADALTGTGTCGTAKSGAYPDRCGYGPRLPLMVISPYAKQNYVDNTLTDQSSVLKFIEDNWKLGTIGDQSTDAYAGSLDNMFNFNINPKTVKPLILNPSTGEVVRR
ncbi:MAG TPA: alkaline phosphatase family protein [Dictyobacter sp.]|jgi:phospholipase C|nr:alkaline phosphatase family protein [Dictyobacter sp.]